MADNSEAIDDLVGGLLTWGRQCGAILSHMAEHSNRELGNEESMEILAGLIRPIIEPVADRRGPGELGMVAAVLLDTYHLVADELFLVNEDG